MSIKRTGLAVLMSFMLVPAISSAQQGEWLVAPYIWASDVSWKLPARGDGGIDFPDLVDKIDGAGLIRIEYARNKIGFTFDYVGMSLSDRRRFTVGPVQNELQANLDLTTFEAGVFYRPSATDNGFDVIAGVRDVDADSYVILTIGDTQPQRFDTRESFTDFYVGGRYLYRINDSWDWSIRGDYGFGGSDGAVNLMAQLGWRSRGAFGMSLAYRHLAFDFEDRVNGEPVSADFSFSGPALGFLFRF